MPSKKSKPLPFRVSYYFADTADSDGRVRLHTAVAKAKDVDDAAAQVVEKFRGTPGGLVIRSVYRSKKAPSMKRRATYIYVPELAEAKPEITPCPECGSLDKFHFTSPENGCYTEDPSNPYSKFVGEIKRPLGPCKWHPTAVVLKNGYCTALEPVGLFPLSEVAYPEFLKEWPLAEVSLQQVRTEVELQRVLDSIADGTGTVEDLSIQAEDLPASDVRPYDSGHPDQPIVCEDPATCGSSEHGSCVSQETKDEVYAKCEAEVVSVSQFPQLPAYGGISLGADGIKRVKTCHCPTWCFCIWPFAPVATDNLEAEAKAVATKLVQDPVVVSALAEEGLKINPRQEADKAIDEILGKLDEPTPTAEETPRESWVSERMGAILLGTGIAAWVLVIYGPRVVHYLQGLVR